MAQYTALQLVSASNATYFSNTSGQISASAVRDFNDSWISSSALLSGSNTFVGNQIISGSLTAQLQANYIWLGNSSGYNQAVATSSISLQGAQGTQGTQGTQGVSGSNGAQGVSGSQGTTGAQGITGSQGVQGIQGVSGQNGTQGAQGESGGQGSAGQGGTQGAQGISGSNGTQGVQGTQGAFGQGGTQGIQGGQGFTGGAGQGGTQGAQGATGTGTQGATGAQGSTGASNAFFNYQAKDTITSGDPLSGHIIWNNVTQSAATSISVSDTDQNSNNIDVFLSNIQVGTTIVLQDQSSQSNYQKWEITSRTDNTTYWTYGVTLITSTYSFPNNHQMLFVISAGAQGTQGVQGTTGQSVTGAQGANGAQGATGAASQLVINNNNDNNVLTATGTSTLQGENNLTFNGSTLGITGNINVSSTLTASLQEGYAWVGNGSNISALVPTSSFGGSTNTGSLMVTGSVAVNVLTFTKGDGSTFNLTVAASGSSPAGTVSSSQQIIDYNIFAVKSGSNDFRGINNFSGSAGTGIVNIQNTGKLTLGGIGMPYNETALISMVAGDGVNQGGALQFQVSNGGAAFNCGNAPSGSTQTTGSTPLSFENNTISGSILFNNTRNTGAIRFDNDSGSINLTAKNTGSIGINAGGTISISGSLTRIQDFRYPTVDGTNGQVLTTDGSKILTFTTPAAAATGSLMTTGSVSGNVLTFTKGDGSTFDLTVAASGSGATFTNPSVESISGSLLLTANTFTSGSANLLHLSASAQNQANLVFKNNNTTATTIISGSSNIYTNPATPTTGYTRYIGGSNNLYLNSTNGINSQITQSAASVSGNRAAMNNNIFAGTVGFTINQAVNTGEHDYSNNIFNGNGNVTINALSHTGSISVTANITPNGNITINASSASVAEIATGISGSGNVNVRGNIVQGNGSITITSPRRFLPTNTQSTLGNFVAGGTLTVTNISSSAAVTSNNNVLNAGISYTNAGAAGLGLHTTAGSINNNYGGGTIIASGSAVNFNFNTTSGNNLTVTNQAWSGSYGVGVFNILRNIFFGQSGILLITGSVDGTGNTTGAFTDNAVIGKSNTIFSNQSGADVHNSFISNVVGGEQLIISASNSFNSTIGGGAYFGRYNANDGVRNKTGQTVFSVGTGNSTARKTGFLIDSGSNTFVEGSLNVSGSSSLTGSLVVSSFTTLASVSSSLNFADDTAAAAGGVPLGGLYRNGNFVMIRLT